MLLPSIQPGKAVALIYSVMGGRAIGWAAAVLLVGGCGTSPAPQASNQATMLKVAFKQGGTYRYHYSARLEGTIAMGQAVTLPIKSDSSADAVWKVVSVGANGDTTVQLTLSNLKTTVTSSFMPGTTMTTVTGTATQQFQFKVTSTGEVVPNGGPPMVLPPALPLGPGLSGSDQFVAILPGRPVGPGDSWTKAVTRPGPLGQSSITYTAQNRFLRYENLKSGRAAVIETTTTVPIDITVNIGAFTQVVAPPGSPSPPASNVTPVSGARLQGTTTTVSTTWFDTKTDQVEKMTSVVTSDVTSNVTLTAPIALPSMPPGLPPMGPGQVPPVALGPQHFTAKQTLEFDLLS